MIPLIPEWYYRPITVGHRGDDVVVVQRKLGVKPTGEFEAGLVPVVRGYQHVMGLPCTGYIDELTAMELGPEAGAGLLPDWFDPTKYKDRVLSEGEPGWDVVADLLGVEPSRAVLALKRFQGNNGLRPTGVVDEWTARKLGQ